MPATSDDYHTHQSRIDHDEEKGYHSGMGVPTFTKEKGYHAGDTDSLVVDIGKCKGIQGYGTTQKADYSVCTVSGTIFVYCSWHDPIPEMLKTIVYKLSVHTSEDSVGDWELPEKWNELTVDLDEREYSVGKSSEDSVGGCELPEKGNELTVKLDELEDNDGQSSEDSMSDCELPENKNKLDELEDSDVVSASKQPEESLEEIKDKTSDQKPERFIQSEQDTVRHEEICSPVTDASKEFKCPPYLRELFTLVPTPADNTCGENTHSSAKSTSTKNSLQVNSETPIQVSLTKDKASGRNVVGGNDSTQNTKGQSTQQQKQQQKQQQQSASGGDSSNVGGAGAGGHGNGRRRDDGDGRRRGDGDGRNNKPAGGQKNKEKEEEDDEDEEKQDEEDQKQVMNVSDAGYIAQCLVAYMHLIRDRSRGIQTLPTEFTRSGERCLGHLEQCRLGHTACKDCHGYLCTIEDLVASKPVDAAVFPFYEEYRRADSNNREERHLVILEWLYGRRPDKYIKVEECREKLKRIRSSSGQGACPKKRVRQAVASRSSSNEPMEMTPSPEESPPCTTRFCCASRGHVLRHQDDRPRVFHGTRAELHRKIQNWMRNPDATDGEFNDGVIFHEVPDLIPDGGYYRFNIEFHYLKSLGTGSYGQVFLCFDGITNKHFVCKMVELENFEEEEVLIWMQLEHKHIIPLWGVVRHSNSIMMISAYVPSRQLPIRLDDNLLRSDRQIVKWIQQLLDVLKYIHSKNIVHMDIKPGNLLLTYEQDIVVIDWGLAMKLNNNGLQHISQPRGTELFMAREVVLCETFNASVDVWSTICAAINLFSGSPPWVNRFPNLPSYQYIIGTRGPPVEDIPASLDPIIRDFLMRGLGNDQGRPTASELLEHPMFRRDNFTRQLTQPTFPQDLNIEKSESEEMETDRFPIPPPDGLPDFDFSMVFKPLGDSGGCDLGQNLPAALPQAQQQGQALSPECRVRDSPWLDSCTILQPLGQASPPGALADVASDQGCNLSTRSRPQVLVLPQGSLYQDNSPELDDLTSQIDQLNINEDDEDLYGPGPPDRPGQQDTPGSPLLQRPPDRQLPPLASRPPERSVSTDISVTPDRRSSSQSSVFGELFQCLPPTPDTDSSVDKSLSTSVYSPPARAASRESISSSADQLRLIDQFYSEISHIIDGNLDHQLTEMQMVETGTSGIGTASGGLPRTFLTQDARKPVQRSRMESQSSRSHSDSTFIIQLYSEELQVQCGTLTYGELAEGISSKVLRKFCEKGKTNARFTLTDRSGNSFHDNDKADHTCEIVIAEADPDGDWDWCITPDKRLERKE